MVLIIRYFTLDDTKNGISKDEGNLRKLLCKIIMPFGIQLFS